MKLLIFITVFFTFSLASLGQNSCTGLLVDLSKNARPDTITTYFFGHDTVSYKNIPKSIPITNYSFKTNAFKISWVTTTTTDMQKVVNELLKTIGQRNIVDTIHRHILNRYYTIYAVKKGRKKYCILISDRESRQDTFIAYLIKNSDYKQCVDYLEKYLQ